MTKTKAPVERLPLAHGKDARSRGDAAVTHHDAAIMQGGFGMENREQQLNGKVRVDDHARFLVNPNRRIALDRDKRAELFVRELRDRFRDIMDGLALLARERKNRMPPKLGQPTTQLRLKNHDERHRQKHGETADDPADDDQVQQLGDQRQGQENDRQAGEHLGTASSSEIEVAVIDPDAQQDDFSKASPPFEPELEK